MRFIVAMAGMACTTPTDQRLEWTPHADAVEAWEQANPGARGEAEARYVPIRNPGDTPDVTVYGYWPYWGDPLDTLPWDQLTHLAIFDVILDSNGSISSTQHWDDNAADAVALAAPWGVKVHLVVTSFDDFVMDAVLTDPAKRTAAISELANMVVDYGADGVNVDFEGMDAHLKNDLVDFVDELQAATGEVFIAMPAVDWNSAYDFDELALASDGLFLMGYDYHWAGGDPGPVAPLDGGALWGTYDLGWTVDDYRTWGATDDKLILGLPLYGREWSTTNNVLPGTSTGSSSTALFADAVVDGASFGRQYDPDGESAYAFPSGSSQLFYDDPQSIEAKVAWAIDEGLAGVGFWAMTYDDGDADLWSRIDAETHIGGIRLDGPTPGHVDEANTLTVTGAMPGNTIGILFSQNLGQSPVPSCPIDTGLASPTLLPTVVADASGTAVLTFTPPVVADGLTVSFQAVDKSVCEVSNLQTVTFVDTPPPPPGVSACYPGVLEDYTTCLPVVADNGFGADYAYPAPIGSNYEAPTNYLDLSVEDPATMLAPNFRLDEIAQEFKGQYGIVQVHAIERLQTVRDALGALNINSGYRNPGYNASVGGALASRHMYGDAFDISPSTATLSQLEAECYAEGAGFVQVYATHVHCDWRDDAQEDAFYGAPAPRLGPAPDPLADLGARIHPSPSGLLSAPAEGFECGEPLREWVAYDAAGQVLDTFTGPHFDPPKHAVEVAVTVGRNLTVRHRL